MKGSGEEVRHHRGDIEPRDWDADKERRHREAKELERNDDTAKASHKKSVSDRSHRHEAKTEVCMHTNCCLDCFLLYP